MDSPKTAVTSAENTRSRKMIDALAHEMRIYLDPSDPDSDFLVALPVTSTDTVFDPDTGERLADSLTENTAKLTELQQNLTETRVIAEEAKELAETGGRAGIPPLNVSGVSVLASSGSISLKWAEPEDTVIDGVLSEWEGTRVVIKAGSPSASHLDGALVLDNRVRNAYKNEPFTISGLTNGVTYYIQFFPYSNAGAVNNNATNRFAVTPALLTINAVPTPTGVLTYNGASQSPGWSNYNGEQLIAGGVMSGTNAGVYMALFTPKCGYQWADGTTAAKSVSWSIGKAAGSLSINPAALTFTKGGSTTAAIAVARSGDGTVTAQSSDNTLVTVSVSGTTVTATNVGDKNGIVTITIKVAAGTNYAAPSDKTVSVSLTGYARTFGAKWNKNESPTALTRTYDAVGKTFTPSIGTTEGSSGFDNEPIYRDIKLCNVVDGAVTYYQGEAGFSRTPATGDVMVEIPKFYYKIVEETDTREYIISDVMQEGFFVSPAHMDRGDGKGERGKIYVSAYTLNSSYRSISGNNSQVSMTIAAARSACSGRGSQYWQYDYATFMTILFLCLVEVADWDQQATIGYGYADANAGQLATGGADGVAGHSGRHNTNATAGKNAVKYRHIENLWGNIRQFVDGISVNTTDIYICLNPANFSDDPITNYTKLSYSKVTANGYIKALGIDTTYPFAQVPTDTTGSNSTYIPDYYFHHGSGWRLVTVGGSWIDGLGAGMLYNNPDSGLSGTSGGLGARLIILP